MFFSRDKTNKVCTFRYKYSRQFMFTTIAAMNHQRVMPIKFHDHS